MDLNEKLAELFDRADKLEDGSEEQLKVYKEIQILAGIIHDDTIVERDMEKKESDKKVKVNWTVNLDTIIKTAVLAATTIGIVAVEKKGVIAPKQVTTLMNKML